MQQYPEHWTSTRIEDFALVKGGKRLPKGEKLSDTATPYPYIRVTDFENFRVNLLDLKYLKPETHQAIQQYTISKDDIYISIAGTIGVTGKIPNEVDGANLTENAAKIVLTSDAIDSSFVMFYLASDFAQQEIKSQTVKNAQPKLALTRIKKLEIPTPPLSEQRRIAHVLTTVQTAIEQQARMIALTRELKSALMGKLFTEGLHGEKQKETEIGLVPARWEVVKLGEAVEYVDYGYSAPIPKTAPDNGIKIVSTADINRQGEMLYRKIRYTTAPEKTIQRLTLVDGDVLFNWRNSAELIGKTAVFEQQPEPHIFASFILRIRCDEKKTHNYFLKHLMNHYREQEVFVKLSRRAVNQANYNKNEISELKIPFPPYDEQVKIAETVGAVENKIHAHESKKNLLEELFRTLLHQLMRGEVRTADLRGLLDDADETHGDKVEEQTL